MAQAQEMMEDIFQSLAEKAMMLNQSIEELQIQSCMPEKEDSHKEIISQSKEAIEKLFSANKKISILSFDKIDDQMKKFVFILTLRDETKTATLFYLATNEQELNKELNDLASKICTQKGYKLNCFRDWARHSFLGDSPIAFVAMLGQTIIQLQ